MEAVDLHIFLPRALARKMVFIIQARTQFYTCQINGTIGTTGRVERTKTTYLDYLEKTENGTFSVRVALLNFTRHRAMLTRLEIGVATDSTVGSSHRRSRALPGFTHFVDANGVSRPRR